MKLFVDTSALYALLDRDDVNHQRASATWREIHRAGQPILTHNYVLVEVSALVQRRLGMDALQALSDDLLGPVEIFWIPRELHELATASLLASRQREVSLVDWASFQVMRELGLKTTFAFDMDFTRLGFATIPA